jgi:hypothetical protein
MTLVQVASLCADAARDRAQIAWQTLFRFVTTSGITYYEGLAEDLKKVIADHLPENLVDLKGFVKEEAEALGLPDLISQLQAEVEGARATTLAKINGEIELFVISLKNRAQVSKDQPEQTVFNIYSPVGAIQTGATAVAYVSQTIDTATRDKLLNVLRELEQRLETVDSLPKHPKHEIIELVKESETEVRKETPNSTKLRTILSAIATSIQTVADLRPAYEGLKEALMYFGITLP